MRSRPVALVPRIDDVLSRQLRDQRFTPSLPPSGDAEVLSGQETRSPELECAYYLLLLRTEGRLRASASHSYLLCWNSGLEKKGQCPHLGIGRRWAFLNCVSSRSSAKKRATHPHHPTTVVVVLRRLRRGRMRIPVIDNSGTEQPNIHIQIPNMGDLRPPWLTALM